MPSAQCDTGGCGDVCETREEEVQSLRLPAQAEELQLHLGPEEEADPRPQGWGLRYATAAVTPAAPAPCILRASMPARRPTAAASLRLPQTYGSGQAYSAPATYGSGQAYGGASGQAYGAGQAHGAASADLDVPARRPVEPRPRPAMKPRPPRKSRPPRTPRRPRPPTLPRAACSSRPPRATEHPALRACSSPPPGLAARGGRDGRQTTLHDGPRIAMRGPFFVRKSRHGSRLTNRADCG